jgi:preprotein translocase subunit SecF
VSTTDDTDRDLDLTDPDTDLTVPVASKSVRRRLYYGETAYDFFGKRWWGIGVSALLVLISVASFAGRGFNLGLDFVGGVSWDVPAESLTVDDARQVLTDNGLDGGGARVQELSGDSGVRLKLELKEQAIDVREAVRADLAEAAGVTSDDVDVRAVSARWGDTVTNSAVRALIVFLVLIVAFITLRFEWRWCTTSSSPSACTRCCSTRSRPPPSSRSSRFSVSRCTTASSCSTR